MIVVAGVLTPLVGVDRARAIVEWWPAQGSAFLRVWAGVALVFGVFLTYHCAADAALGPRVKAWAAIDNRAADHTRPLP